MLLPYIVFASCLATLLRPSTCSDAPSQADGIRIVNKPSFNSQKTFGGRCGYDVRVKTGTPHRLASPNYPENYPNNAQCAWTFRPADAKNRLVITCSAFGLAPVKLCNKLEDFVVVETQGSPAQWFCGGVGPHNVIGKSLRVTFWSNEKDTRRGFLCYVAALSGAAGGDNPAIPFSAPHTEGSPFNALTHDKDVSHKQKCYCGVRNLPARDTRSDSAAGVQTDLPSAATGDDTSSRQLILDIPDSKIVKGEPVDPHEFPWLVLLEYPSQPGVLCSGALVTSKYVVTAAHCTSHSRDMPMVILGEHDRFNHRDTFRTLRLRARSILTHPKYHAPSYDNDIALIKLEREVDFDKVFPYIAPICAPNPGDRYEGEETFVVGWGSTSEKDRRGSGIPLRASVNTVTQNDCIARYYPTPVTENMICAVGKGTDTCQNDSGGPLMAKYKAQRYVLAGVVSWGIGCARPNFPGVYTRVGNYVDWILANTRDSRACPPLN